MLESMLPLFAELAFVVTIGVALSAAGPIGDATSSPFCRMCVGLAPCRCWYWQSCWKRVQFEHVLSPSHFLFNCWQRSQALIVRCLFRTCLSPLGRECVTTRFGRLKKKVLRTPPQRSRGFDSKSWVQKLFTRNFSTTSQWEIELQVY